jgi:hypothetical protein
MISKGPLFLILNAVRMCQDGYDKYQKRSLDSGLSCFLSLNCFQTIMYSRLLKAVFSVVQSLVIYLIVPACSFLKEKYK